MSSASSQTPRLHLCTFADLLAIPEERRFHEILDGELVQKATPGGEHGTGQISTAAFLKPRFSRQPNGPSRPGGWWFATEVTIELDLHDTVQPDIAGWRRTTLPEGPRGYPIRVAPDWVCEVMTGSEARRRDSVQKRRIYALHHVAHYWLIDTDRKTLTVLRLTPSGYIDALQASHQDRVHAEPFDAIELPVGVLFGDDEDLRGRSTSY